MLAGTGFVGYNVNNLNMTLLKIQEESVEFEPPQVDKGSLSMPEQDESKPVWGDANRINIMILGSDAGPDRWGVRPDILMVASINTITGNTNLFNVPRDMLYARFPEGTGGAQAFPNGFTSHGGMVNAVWTWAESRPDLYPGNTQPGLVATRDVLSETFGLDIQHYIVLNLRGFEDFVNVMGGVTLNIPRDIPYNNGDLAIPAGDNQRLNGEKALWFARERKTNSDYDRMQRQRCVVGALVDQITPTKILTQTERLMSILGDNLSTNLKQEDISDWVGLFEKVQKASLTGFAFIPPHINPANPDYGFIKGKVTEIITADDAANTPETPPTPRESEGTDETDEVSTPSVEPSDTPPPPPVDSGYENPYCTT
jgi:LCP family protein required for cell wall assembly